MKRWLGGGLLLLALLLGGAWAARAPLGVWLVGRIAADRAGRDLTAGLPDGLHVLLCGTGSPLPDPSRAESCTLVVAGRTLLLVDAGDGAARNLGRWGVPLGRLQAVLVTHLHSDHVEGLPGIALQRWVGGAAQTPLPLLGPPGVEQLAAGFSMALTADNGWRTAHHGPAIAPPAGAGMSGRAMAPGVVWNRDGVVVTAFLVNHTPVAPAYGYRVDYKGRSVVISGDTAASPAVVAAAKGADVLVHEALQPNLLTLLTDALAAKGQAHTAQITRDIVGYHATPEQAAESAASAGVRALVLTHIVPPMPTPLLDAAFLGDAASRFNGPISVGRDGLLISLPAGGTEISQRMVN